MDFNANDILEFVKVDTFFEGPIGIINYVVLSVPNELDSKIIHSKTPKQHRNYKSVKT